MVTPHNGSLQTGFSLPAYVSLDESRGLDFVYNSNRAYPFQLVPVEPTIPVRAAVPPKLSVNYNLSTVAISQTAFISTVGLNENINEPLRAVLPVDTSSLNTGVYKAALRLTSHYNQSAVSTANNDPLLVVNEQNSPFGAGWGLAGLSRLYENSDGSLLLTDGDGSAKRYAANSFNFTSFSNLDVFILNGDTATINSEPVVFNGQTVLRLTSTKAFQAGNAFLNQPIPLQVGGDDISFNAAFQFQISDSSGLSDGDGPGADGLAFILATNTNVGVAGGGIGYQGIDPSLVIEFDTFNNGGSDDNSGNHVGINLNGNLDSVVLQPVPTRLNNGEVQYVWVDYDGSTHLLEVRLSATAERPAFALVTHTVDIAAVLGQTSAFMGFTSSTGSGYGNHDIRAIAFNISLPSGSNDFNNFYFPPVGDYSSLTKHNDGTYSRHLKNGTEINFNATGLQTSIIDRNSNTTRYAYDAKDRLTTITDPAGLATRLTYVENNLNTVIDPNGRVTNFHYDDQNNFLRVDLPDGTNQAFGYDSRHLMTAETNQRGLVTTRVFDKFGRITEATLPDGSVRRTSASQKIGLIDLSSGVGSEANPAPVVRPNQALSELIDGEGRLRVYSTGPVNRFASSTDPAGLTTTYNRDQDGNVTKTTPPSGAIFEQSYDAQGNMSAFTDKTLNGTTNFTYNSTFNQVTSITDPFNRVTNFAYDGLGNLTQITTPLNRTVTLAYTGPGLVSQMTDALGTVATFSYNGQSNLTQIRQGTGAEQRVTELSYTGAGYIETLTDAVGRVFAFDYDVLGRLTQETLPGNRVISYGYDNAGNLTALTPPGKPAHTFTYNEQGLLATYTAPAVDDGGGGGEGTNLIYLPLLMSGRGTPTPLTVSSGNTNQTSYSYNKAEQLTQITRPDGQTLDYDYDSAGRLKTLTTPRGQFGYSYGASSGLLTGLTAPDNTLIYNYNNDILSKVTWAGPINGNVGYTYDRAARLTQLSVNNSPISFSYDADDMLTKAGDLTLSYEAASGLLDKTSLGGVSDDWSFNPFAEVSGYSATFNSSPLYTTQYTRDKLGRISQKVETMGGTTTTYAYSYDEAGRLSQVQSNGATTEAYTYDLNGNRLTGPGGETGTYDAQDRLLTYGANSYSYTANGELTGKTNGGQTTTYDYDVLGNLLGVTLPTGTALTYLVDGQGRRIGKKVNGTLERGFLYQDDLSPIAELDGAGNVVSTFIYGSRGNVPDYMVKGGVKYRLISDQLGSVRLVVDSQSGTIAQRLDYDAFGRVLNDTAPGFQPFGFAGGLYDPATGLVRFGARDYDAEVGRWTTKDPIGFAGGDANLYGYVGGDPVNLSDPTGEILPVLIGIAIVTGGIAVIHWTRNYWNDPISDFDDVRGWTELTPEESIFHRMGPGNENNRKFVSPDGHSETVFRPRDCGEKPRLVTDPANVGTYNFFGPRFAFGIPHVIFDVVPYFVFGNSPSDMFNLDRFRAL